MIGKIAEELIKKESIKNNLIYSYGRINLKCEDTEDTEEPITNADLRYFEMAGGRNGYLKYSPKSKIEFKNNEGYVISFYGLLIQTEGAKEGVLRIRDWEDLLERAEKSEELQFILKWFNINKKLFKIAQRYINLALPVAFDIIGYHKEMEKKSGKKYIFRTLEQEIEIMYKFAEKKPSDSRSRYYIKRAERLEKERGVESE